MKVERKFLENDLVVIVAKNSNHGFEIGERVKLSNQTRNGWIAEKLDDSEHWFVGDEEIELTFENGDLVKVRGYEELCKEFEPDIDGDFYFDSGERCEYKIDIEEYNEDDVRLEVFGIRGNFIVVREEDGEFCSFSPEILEFDECKLNSTSDEIKVGSIVRGINDRYAFTNSNMTEALVTKVKGDFIGFVMLSHNNRDYDRRRDIDYAINKRVEFYLPKSNFELVSQEVKTPIKKEPYIPFKVTITSDGKTTNCTYEEYGKVKEVQARLHPEDEFDFKTGVELCVERAFDNSIKEGGVVEVVNDGKMYSMLINNNIPLDLACKFCYDSSHIKLDKEYKVIKKAKHSEGDLELNKKQLLLIQDRDRNVYLISEDGVKKVEN